MIKDIKSLKIQGAENIAKSAISLIKDQSRKRNLKGMWLLRKKLESTRPTEPCLRNTLKFLFHHISSDSHITKLSRRCDATLKHLLESDKKISLFGAKKISDGDVVFTHCHSSAVINIFKQAKKEGKKFKVLCTETRPRFQGRITASALIKAKIPTTLFVDSGMRIALKQADLCLIGADAITTEGKVINKIGSEIIAKICQDYDIPIYSCTNSWKFDPESVFGFEEIIEQRASKEVWDNPPKGLKISNYAFEKVKGRLITGIISEIGVYESGVFVEEMERQYPWMFEGL